MVSKLRRWSLLFLLGIGFLPGVFAAGLSWRMAVFRNEGGNVEELPLNVYEMHYLRDGQNLQIHVEADQDAFLYVLAENTKGFITVLAQKVIQAGRWYDIPDHGWFPIKPPAGLGKFIVVMSLDRQTELEAYLKTLQKSINRIDDSDVTVGRVDRIRDSMIYESHHHPSNIEGPVFWGLPEYVKIFRFEHY